MKKNSQDINFTKNSPQITEVLSSLIFESNLYMAWISGKDAILTQFNERWLSFTGRTVEEEKNNGWTNLVHPNDLVRCIYKYKNAFNSRNEFKIRYRLKRHDDNYYWTLNHGWPIVDKSNSFLGYIGLCDLLTKDKSPKKKNEELLYDKNDQLIPIHKHSVSSITRRETEIIELLIQGYRNKQIAMMLQISTNTVRNHIFNIFSKYNVSNRVQLINQIIQLKT